MANLKQGSSGNDVKKMQQALIDAGYDVGSTGADGKFGQNTLSAVKQYQKDNGLAVDGIAGKNTLGSLYSNNSGSNAQAIAVKGAETPATTGGFTYKDFTYKDFAASDIVNQAWDVLQQHNANRPDSYTPVWQDEAEAYLSQYQNRDPFSYDFNSDALYNQYKDMYIQQGQMAMMDTMGQAAALTGGYGNSYAQAAGQQAYNQYLSQLNNIMPELYQMAHDRYAQEGQRMLDMYDLYMGREEQEYGKYQDGMDRWYQEYARLQDNYDTLYGREFDEYQAGKDLAYNEYQTGRSEAYDDYQKTIDREYQKERDAVADEQWQKQYDLQKKASRSTGNNSGDGQKYITPSPEMKSVMEKDFGRASTVEKVNYYANLYKGMGYDPDIVALMARERASELSGGGNNNTTVSIVTDPLKDVQKWVANATSPKNAATTVNRLFM